MTLKKEEESMYAFYGSCTMFPSILGSFVCPCLVRCGAFYSSSTTRLLSALNRICISVSLCPLVFFFCLLFRLVLACYAIGSSEFFCSVFLSLYFSFVPAFCRRHIDYLYCK